MPVRRLPLTKGARSLPCPPRRVRGDYFFLRTTIPLRLPAAELEVDQLFGATKLKNCVFVLKNKNELSNSRKIGSKIIYHEKIDLDYPLDVYFFISELSIQPILFKRRS